MVEDALRATIGRQRRHRPRTPVTLPTFSGGRLRPGVNLDDGAGLRDLMEEPRV